MEGTVGERELVSFADVRFCYILATDMKGCIKRGLVLCSAMVIIRIPR